MKVQKMVILGRDRQRIAELYWEDGVTSILECDGHMRIDLERMISHGLDEWVGLPEDPHQRWTASSESCFLERLGSYLKRQTGFIITLSELVTLSELDVAQ